MASAILSNPLISFCKTRSPNSKARHRFLFISQYNPILPKSIIRGICCDGRNIANEFPSISFAAIQESPSVSKSFVAFASDVGKSGSNEGEMESNSVSTSSADEIVLDVTGMMCDGCVASVTRILENQPQVSSATVNLATETAVVHATPEAQATQNWQQQLGEKLANHLTNCGFKSNLRG